VPPTVARNMPSRGASVLAAISAEKCHADAAPIIMAGNAKTPTEINIPQITVFDENPTARNIAHSRRLCLIKRKAASTKISSEAMENIIRLNIIEIAIISAARQKFSESCPTKERFNPNAANCGAYCTTKAFISLGFSKVKLYHKAGR